MQYSQSNQGFASETKLQWKPIKQMSYMAKLNNFAAEHANDYSYQNQNSSGYNQYQSWSPNNYDTSYNTQQMNTWPEKQSTFGQSYNYLQTHYQNMSESQARVPFKKMRNLSNEDNKMVRHVSDFTLNGQNVQQSHLKDLSQNQISVQQTKSKNGQFTINLDKNVTEGSFHQEQSSLSSKASTNDNCNSDVEIIDDDFSKTLQPMEMGLKHFKSTHVNHQTTLDNREEPMQLQKVYSTFSSCNHNHRHDHYNHTHDFDELSCLTGEATRSSQKKKFVNKEERFEFNQKIEKMKKTEMCRNIIMYGHCKYGHACSYAHTSEELVPKQHLPSNYKTKMCTQYQQEGYCMYGQRCQFLHSIYDLTDKTNLSYKRGLAEEARLTWQRIQQGSDCIMVNILKGKGCVAPDERLPCFEAIYNKQDYQAELQKKEQEKQQKCYSNSYGNNFDKYTSYPGQNLNTKMYRKSEPWSNKEYANNNWGQRNNFFDNGSGMKTNSNYRRYPTYK